MEKVANILHMLCVTKRRKMVEMSSKWFIFKRNGKHVQKVDTQRFVQLFCLFGCFLVVCCMSNLFNELSINT